ncbi:hypothetical protein LPTSP4_20900 [Leptospira ryugenii]|uniref:Uncharacterized protein n=1 Tax=Leptospira ryugenii TaxID=1917863 RepID=A0A2P2E112_9LEPT|nr:hypothetical protein [Leptospira ryugenii]GBF50564.1 hypothetical protein LPTSP4_20900 [Leptospira ryugenii]
MDLLEIDKGKFKKYYSLFTLLGGILVSSIVKGCFQDANLSIFLLGYSISLLVQISAIYLRLLPIERPALREGGFAFFTVFFSFFLNLAFLSALIYLDYPFEAIGGFLIAYFLSLLFFVIASYISGKKQ